MPKINITGRYYKPARAWYDDSRAAIERVYGNDARLFSALLAATSPRATIKANVTLARKAYNQYKTTGEISREGFINTHYRCLHKYITTGKMRGRKVNSLFQNLLGNSDPVTVDIWMLRYAGIHQRKAPTKFDYDYIEDRVKEEAGELGISPAARQAELWSIARGNDDSYADYIKQYRLI